MLTRRDILAVTAVSLLPGTAARAAAPARVITNSIALEDGRVWIAASVQGKGPFLFILDTGAVVSLIQEKIARDLGLKASAPVKLQGVGGAELFTLYVAHDIVFSGGARQTAVFAAAERHLALGPDAAGALAAGMVTALDADLDFEKGELRIYPDGRGDRGGFAELPSRIMQMSGPAASAYMFVDAVLDGGRYRFLLDTGMSGQVLLWPGAVRRSGLWSDKIRFAPRRSSGIGGDAQRGRLVRGSALTLGDIAFERPLVALSNPSGPSRIASWADGIIGLELIERLTLSTDVRRGRLWARRNARPPSPERYGLSGLWVEERGGNVVVEEVSPQSPAADAGLRVGDEIVGIPLRAFIGRLGGKPGESIPVTVRRGGETISTAIVLRAFL
jgi:serine protease Do